MKKKAAAGAGPFGIDENDAGGFPQRLLDRVRVRVLRQEWRELGGGLKRLGLTSRPIKPAQIDTWSLTSLQQRLVKTGGRLVKHARYYWLLLAESHLTRRLFGAMLQRIWALPVPTG